MAARESACGNKSGYHIATGHFFRVFSLRTRSFQTRETETHQGPVSRRSRKAITKILNLFLFTQFLYEQGNFHAKFNAYTPLSF